MLLDLARPGAVDLTKERPAPPQPTLVYFPQNDIRLQSDDDWPTKAPNLFRDFCQIQKPSDVLLSHVAALNFTTNPESDIEELIPILPDYPPFLPPKEWLHPPEPATRRPSSAHGFSHSSHYHTYLSNGAKAPEPETFMKYARELVCDTDDAFNVVGHRKTRPGHTAPHLGHFREFWDHLDIIGQYWDARHDHYYEGAKSAPPSPSSPRSLKRMAFFSINDKASNHDPPLPGSSKKYKGRRISCGSKMPDQHRVDMVRSFVRAIASCFDCTVSIPRDPSKLQIKTLLIPVSQSGVAWRHPGDKQLAKQGFNEGPLLGVQCRAETGFIRDPHAAVVDIAREAACLLQLAQERARDGKPPVIPGQNKWWVTRRRWGGGPGGEFGEAEQKAMEDASKAPTNQGRRGSSAYGTLPLGKTEEQLWRELKPGKSLWQPRTNYAAIGHPSSDTDTVFMVSSLYHHISILRLDVHPRFLEFIIDGKVPKMLYEDDSWCKPRMSRTRWYDMLVAEDRGEAFRALWGVFTYLTRPSPSARPGAARNNSEGGGGILKSFRKKHMEPVYTPLVAQRSHSIA